MVVTELVAPIVYEIHSALRILIGLVPLEPVMPHVTSKVPPGSGKFEKVLSWGKWVSLGICILGLISAGAVMAVQSRRGEGSEHLHRVGMALMAVVIISASSTLVGVLA